MAKIQKIELNLGQKFANPFKTTRKSTTNPFKYNDFEGNTLDVAAFADVFSGTSDKSISKLKMITTSVIGSMTKLRNSITEPIVNFVNRVREGISTTWNNKIINNEGLKNITDKLHATGDKISGLLNYDIGKSISDSISGLGKNITDKLPEVNITGLGKDLSVKWTELVEKIHGKKISSDMSVAELKDLWIKENELIANSVKEAA